MSTSASALLAEPPADDEYLPYYARYIRLVPPGDVADALEAQLPQTVALCDAIGEAGAGHRYAPGKWSVRQMLGHVADAERIFSYRALAVARGEQAPLAAFDENAYVERADFDDRTLGSLLGEFTAARRATLSLFRNLDDAALTRRGTASGVTITPRALAWIIAGHELHHQELLRTRYGASA